MATSAVFAVLIKEARTLSRSDLLYTGLGVYGTSNGRSFDTLLLML